MIDDTERYGVAGKRGWAIRLSSNERLRASSGVLGSGNHLNGTARR